MACHSPPDLEQVRAAAQVDRAAGDDRRRDERLIRQRVGRQHLEAIAQPQYDHVAFLGGEVDLPVGANGKLYLATEEGDVIVLRLADRFEVLATNTLTDQSFIASPLVAEGSIYLRSRTHLFRIGR